MFKENSIRLIDGRSNWEDLGPLMNHQGWPILAHLPKLTKAQKFCILALTEGCSTPADVEKEAGLKGSVPITPGVRLFWRKIAMRLVSIDPYSEVYRQKLDELYKLNEKLVFKDQALAWAAKATPRDEPTYKRGKLPLSHVKTRARMHVLSMFIHELMDAIQ